VRTAAETGTTQENIQDWLELDEGVLGFQILVLLEFLNKGSTVIKKLNSVACSPQAKYTDRAVAAC
jgi:hypothetical protein